MASSRTYKWVELPGPEVAALAQETDVALLPIGCVEMHGPHMPTGADGVEAEGIAELIVQREPAIILPTLYFNINDEMKCYPGTLAFSPELVARIYEELCCEAARNGFRKILLLIGHGGSEEVTRFVQHSFLHRRLGEQQGFTVMEVYIHTFTPREGVLETPRSMQGHGCEAETSFVLRFRPELVHLERLAPLPGGEGPHARKSVAGAWYVIDWIREVPKGYTGKPQLATVEKGVLITEAVAEACTGIVRRLKGYDPARDR